jgi:nitrate/TMAO reductase-like tetraheme cytochrome c subunit
MVVPAADSHVVPQAVNEVQEKVAQLKNRVAEFLLVIAKVAKNMENSLTKTSKNVMDELKELKEYV